MKNLWEKKALSIVGLVELTRKMEMETSALLYHFVEESAKSLSLANGAYNAICQSKSRANDKLVSSICAYKSAEDEGDENGMAVAIISYAKAYVAATEALQLVREINV